MGQSSLRGLNLTNTRCEDDVLAFFVMAALQVNCIYCVNAGCFLRKCQEAKSTKKLKISPEIQKYPRLTVNCIYSFGAIKGSAWECVKMAKLRHAKRRLARELEHAKTLMPKGKMLSFINFWKT